MKTVDGVEVKEGMKVYDLGVEKSAEDQKASGLPTVSKIKGSIVTLSNGKRVFWKGVGYSIGLASDK
jgi:hypothetical protein